MRGCPRPWHIIEVDYVLTLLGGNCLISVGKPRMTEWDDLIKSLKVAPVHKKFRISKSSVSRRPKSFKRRAGLPLDVDHYSKPLKGGGGIHLKDYPSHYELHRDHADANEESLRHLWKDTSNSDKALIALGLYAIDKFAFNGRGANWLSNTLKSILGVR